MADRESFTVRLSPEMKAKLRAFCIEQGITMTGFMEACAQMLDDEQYAESRMDMVIRARQIDGLNRFR